MGGEKCSALFLRSRAKWRSSWLRNEGDFLLAELASDEEKGLMKREREKKGRKCTMDIYI